MSIPSAVFQALGDATRLEIVERLGLLGPMPTLQLVQGLGISRQAATKHLLVLEQAGLIATHSRGRQVLRELRPEALASAEQWLSKRAKSWDQKLSKLTDLLEGSPD